MRSKCWTGLEWMDGWMDTPQTVMTTRAPLVLKIFIKSNTQWQHTVCKDLYEFGLKSNALAISLA